MIYDEIKSKRMKTIIFIKDNNLYSVYQNKKKQSFNSLFISILTASMIKRLE